MTVFLLDVLVRRTVFGFVRAETCLTAFVAILALPLEVGTVLYGTWKAVRLCQARLVVAVVMSAIVLVAGGGLALLVAASI